MSGLPFAPNGASNNRFRSTRMRSIRGVVVLGMALLGCWLLGRWIQGRHGQMDELPADTGPVLLAIQKIGQLHTVTFTMKDVLRQESQHDPEGWVSALPGAETVVHWATHNEALVQAEGSVEAGVDLSQISTKDISRTTGADGKPVLRVHLPPITIYPPTIHLRVVHNDAGPFWRDENIVPRAQVHASRLFTNAAEQSGIRAKAAANAIQTLQGMERALGHNNIEFTF